MTYVATTAVYDRSLILWRKVGFNWLYDQVGQNHVIYIQFVRCLQFYFYLKINDYFSGNTVNKEGNYIEIKPII